MKFEEWWESDGQILHGFVSKQNARAIWQAATAAEREACLEICAAAGAEDANPIEVAFIISKCIRARGEGDDV